MDDSEAWEIDWEKHCIVCGKSVLDGEGFAHLKVEGEMVAICCPLCFKNFDKGGVGDECYRWWFVKPEKVATEGSNGQTSSD